MGDSRVISNHPKHTPSMPGKSMPNSRDHPHATFWKIGEQVSLNYPIHRDLSILWQDNISPSFCTITSSLSKITLHPESHSSATIAKLCMRFLKQKPLFALYETLFNCKLIISFVCMLVLFCIIICFDGSLTMPLFAGADFLTIAAISIEYRSTYVQVLQ